jgi:hypothetical protein
MDKNLDYLMKAFLDRMAMLQEAVSRGNCASFEEYRFTCGQIRGLEAACGIVEDLRHNLENSDE